MTTALSRTLPRTLFAAALALAGSFASFALTVAPAQASSGGYVVALATPLAEARREIIDGTVWRCEGERCLAAAKGERPQSICGKVARKFGPVAKFVTPQGELTAEQLARCNG